MEHVNDADSVPRYSVQSDDADSVPHYSLQSQIARAILAAILISTAAWMLASYVLGALGVPFPAN